MKDTNYTRKVYYYETDKMGIVHHANYIRMFEEARIHFLEGMGLPYEKLEEMGLMMPVLHVECQYKLPLQFGDAFSIAMEISEMTGVRMSITYRLYGGDGKTLHATGLSRHAFVDMSMKPIRLRRVFPDVYQELLTRKENNNKEEADV